MHNLFKCDYPSTLFLEVIHSIFCMHQKNRKKKVPVNVNFLESRPGI